MATSFTPDFTKLSQYDKTSGVIGVRYAADAPITEMELNEMQLIQNEQRRRLVKAIFADGLSAGGSIAFSSGTLTITDKFAFIGGKMIYIESLTKSGIANGSTIYLNIFEQTATKDSAMYKYGQEDGTAITNYILDSRYGQEISRRMVLAYSITTTPVSGADTLEIGVVSSGPIPITWSYTEVSASGSGVDTKEYLYEDAKEITLSWTELDSRSVSGNFKGLNIGDYKSFTLTSSDSLINGLTITVEIAGIDTYTYDCRGGHSIDFVCKDIAFKKRVHSGNSTVGGWTKMELYTYLESTVLNAMPIDLKNVIKAKRVLLGDKSAKASGSWDWHRLKLWLLADIELFGYQTWSEVGYDSGNFKRYPLFRSERHLRKCLLGTSSTYHWYWMLQPSRLNTTFWCTCGVKGDSSLDGLVNIDSGGVVFGFRI